MTSLNIVILDAFETKNELSLHELYEIITEHPEFTWELSIMKHRVRSALYYMQKLNKIARSGNSIYKKL
jgi:hypothetical protein